MKYTLPTRKIIQNQPEFMIFIKVNAKPELVDVYSITGARIRSHVKRLVATKGLPEGIYIVGGEKKIVVGEY